MPYVMSFATCGHEDRHFPNVSEAIEFYAEQQREGVQLRHPARGTFVDLTPGITVPEATEELASVWEWGPDDPLKIRPRLKPRYIAKR